MMRVVELFAGIGAQRMALILAGIPHEVIGISEVDKAALASYRAIYGDCPNLGDITRVQALPSCDLVTYSFPCQDLSLAGNKAGMGEGTRSGLVWAVIRLLESMPERERPEWLLMENVPQVLTSPLWPDLLRRLETMGYLNKWAKLDSSRFGSAQKRVRAFMVSRLRQSPPDLPDSNPCAPMLCLRDIMEPTRDERYIRRIPLDNIRWRVQKEGYHNPQSKGIECRLIDASDPRMETRRIASEDSLCPALRRGCPQKAVTEEEEERVKPLVDRAENLRLAPRGRKAVGSVKDGKERLVVAPSDKAGESTPIAEDLRESFYSRRMLYSSSSSSPTIRTYHSLRDTVKVVQGDGAEEDLIVSILTPREFWRLMGFPEWAYLRASRVSTEAHLYSQAGNSIVVEVLIAIFNAMFRPSRGHVQTTFGGFA